MKRIAYMLRELGHLIRRHKLAFLAPIVIVLLLIGFLAFYLGPSLAITFLYAGV